MLLAARNKPSNWRRVRYLELANQNKAGEGSQATTMKKGIQFGAVPEDDDGSVDSSSTTSNDGVFKSLANNQSPHGRGDGRSMAKRGSVVNGEMLSELDEIENDPDRWFLGVRASLAQ